MTATLVTANNILKEIYEPRIIDQLQDHNKASKRIERTSEGVTSQVGGKYVVFPIHTKRNHGIGARREMEPLPTAQNQGYESARVGLKYLYGSIKLSGPSIKLAKENFQSFASVLDQEVTGVQRDTAKDWNRQLFGTTVGALALASAAYVANVIPSTNTQYMEIGMIVDVYDPTGVTVKASGRIVTDVVKNTSITVDGAAIATGAANDIIVRTGNINREITGFRQIVSDVGQVYNIDPTLVPLWKALVNANGGVNRPLSENLMITMADDIYTNGGEVTVIFCDLPTRRSYFNLLVQQRDFVNTKEFTGGFTGLAFTTDHGDIPVVTDVDCQPNRMYFINEKQMKIYRQADWSFMDMDGNRWSRVVGVDAYEATLFMYAELGTHRRNSHGLLTDLIPS